MEAYLRSGTKPFSQTHEGVLKRIIDTKAVTTLLTSLQLAPDTIGLHTMDWI
jgi:hypothetical protein